VYGVRRTNPNLGGTAQKHLEHLYRKLAVGDRLLAVRTALEAGLAVLPAAAAGKPVTVSQRRERNVRSERAARSRRSRDTSADIVDR